MRSGWMGRERLAWDATFAMSTLVSGDGQAYCCDMTSFIVDLYLGMLLSQKRLSCSFLFGVGEKMYLDEVYRLSRG